MRRPWRSCSATRSSRSWSRWRRVGPAAMPACPGRWVATSCPAGWSGRGSPCAGAGTGVAGGSVAGGGTAVVWPTLFGESAGRRAVGVIIEGLCEDGVGAALVVDDAKGYDQFDVDAADSIDGDRLARVKVTGAPVAVSSDP